MRALVCHAPCDWDALSLEETTPPPMIPGGVRIAISYASVSFAMSLQVAGKYQRTYPMPFTPGTEVAGHVTAIAAGVTQVKPGDRVLAILDWGGLAEEAVVHASTVYPLPADSAAALPFPPAIHLPNAYVRHMALCAGGPPSRPAKPCWSPALPVLSEWLRSNWRATLAQG